MHLSNDGRGYPLGFFIFVHGLVQHEIFANSIFCPQLFLRTRLVLADDMVRTLENFPSGAVVLLQFDDPRVLEILLEAEDQPHVGPAPAVNALIVIANYTDVAACAGK